MKLQPSRRDGLLMRIGRWLLPSLYIANLLVAIVYWFGVWMLQDKPGALWRWRTIEWYIILLPLFIQLLALFSVIKRKAIVPAILIFVGGILFLVFFIYPRMWLLFLSGSVLGIGSLMAAMPTILELLQSYRRSYQEMSGTNRI